MEPPYRASCFAYTLYKHIPDLSQKIILDIPCGIGYYSFKRFEKGAKKVIASDIVKEQVETMKQEL